MEFNFFFLHIRIICISYNQIMKKVIETLASEVYEVQRGGETTMVKIVPQIVSSLRKELTFPEDFKGKSE